MSLTALKKLVESSKATVLVGVAAVMAAMVFYGRMDVQQFLDTIKVLVPAWMVAHAGENGAKHIANGKKLPLALSMGGTATLVTEKAAALADPKAAMSAMDVDLVMSRAKEDGVINNDTRHELAARMAKATEEKS